jgi:hypothetical protein
MRAAFTKGRLHASGEQDAFCAEIAGVQAALTTRTKRRDE